ncbi:MAG: lysophospholipid acyltransferase family protein [Candidatus Pacebacteria bacterium]|nr:lysophospholipid acyltransferase family protein [Candidatus Paceibacterota bacterium]
MFFKLKVSGQEHLKNLSGPLLIIGNHKYFIDSFALGASLSFSSNLYPIRIMGAVDFFYDPVLEFLRKLGAIKIVYWVFSVFPAVKGRGLEEALKIPKRIIEEGGVVFLHPEGQIIKGDDIGKFKRGAPGLALAANAKILPVVFKRGEKHSKRDYIVKFGEVFIFPKNIATPEQGAEYMRDIIVKLYKSLP